MSYNKRNATYNKNSASTNAGNSFQGLRVEEDVDTSVNQPAVAARVVQQKVSFRQIMEEEAEKTAKTAKAEEAEKNVKLKKPAKVEHEEFADHDGADHRGADHDGADGFVKRGIKSQSVTMSAYNDKLGGAFIAAAKKLLPNPEDSKFKTPVKVKYDPKKKEYKITAFAPSSEEADDILSALRSEVKLFIADKDTEVEVSRSNPESFRRFFNGRDAQKLFPYIFTLDEREEGVFVKIFRQGVSMLEFSDAELEFWGIYDFFNGLNEVKEETNIMAELRELSPAIDATVEGFKTKKHANRDGAPRPPINHY